MSRLVLAVPYPAKILLSGRLPKPGGNAWAERPRMAATAFTWVRTAEPEGVYFKPTPGPGDSEGGDLYSP